MRSQLEHRVLATLKSGKVEHLYEAFTVPVNIVVNTQPDFFLPELRTVLEVKGMCSSSLELRKLVNTSLTVREGMALGNVVYSHYLIAVQVSDSELNKYERALCVVNDVVNTAVRSGSSITGLRLLAMLLNKGVEAVPITHKNTSHLVRALKRKRGVNDNSVA